MPTFNDIKALIPLEKCPIQPYFSNRIQLADIIKWVIDQIGPCDIAISTFSTSEEFLRRLHRFKARKRVLNCSLYCDLRAARKTVVLYDFIKSIFDEVHLCENHSKVVLLSNGNYKVAVVTSQNQTRGDRYESGIVTIDEYTFTMLELGFREMAQNSIPLEHFHS